MEGKKGCSRNEGEWAFLLCGFEVLKFVFERTGGVMYIYKRRKGDWIGRVYLLYVHNLLMHPNT